MRNRKILVLVCSLAMVLFVTVSPSFAAGSDTCNSYVEGTIDDSGATGILNGNFNIELTEDPDDSFSSIPGASDRVLDSTDDLVSITCWYHAWGGNEDPFYGNLSGGGYWSEAYLQSQAFVNAYSSERYSTILTLCHEDGTVKHTTASGVWLLYEDRQKANLRSGEGFGTSSNVNYCDPTNDPSGGHCDSANSTYTDSITRGKRLRNCTEVMADVLGGDGNLSAKNANKLTNMNGTGGSDPCAEFFDGGLEGGDGSHYEDTLKATNHVVCSAYDPTKISSNKDMVFATSNTRINIEDHDVVITVAVSSLSGEEPNDPKGIKLVNYPSNIGENGEGRSYIQKASTTDINYDLTKNTNEVGSLVNDGGMIYKEVNVKIKNSDNNQAISNAVGENPNASENYIALTICPADWKEGDSYEKCLYIDTNGVHTAFVMPELAEMIIEEGEADAKCTDNGHGWSWFVCAATKEVSEQVKNLYPVVMHFLNFDPNIFKNESGLYDAWNVARNASNAVLAVILLIIILSQISGIGIDNYGIKKMLPKVIICVILINLSFVLFRAAVDLSNIFGTTIGGIFDSVSQNIKVTTPSGGSSLFGAGISIVVSVAGFFSGIAFLKSGQSIVVLALSAAIIVAVAVLMMFLILVLRQALVLILSVTAPIAILFYLVPAGNATFRKWTKLVSGLLVAFPLCSLVVSGGDFAAKIIVSVMGGNQAPTTGAFTALGFNPFVYIIAVTVNVVPMFFLPKIIIDSTGKLGAIVKGAANRLSRRFSGGFKGTDFAKRRQHGAEVRANRWNAGVNAQGKQTLFGRVTRSRNATRRMAAEEAASRDRAELRDAQYMADHPEEAMFEQNVKDEMQALEDEGVELSSPNGDDIMTALRTRVTDINSAQGRATIEAIARSAASSRTHGNKKAPVDETIMRFLNENGATQETMASVARARLKRSGNSMLAKSPSDYIKYQDMIAGTHVETDRGNANGTAAEQAQAARYQAYQNSVMRRVIHSEHFSGGALAGYAGGEVNDIADFYNNGATQADRDIIRSAYDNRGDQRAGESDADTFKRLRQAIGH